MEEVKKIVDSLNEEWKEFRVKHEDQLDKRDNLEEKMNINIDSLKEEISDNSLEFKSFASDEADKGQVLISPEKYNRILENLKKRSLIRKLASNITVSSNYLELIIQEGGFDSGWVSEKGARDETNTPDLKRKHIAVNEIYAQPKATQRLINDESVNFEEWLSNQLSESFARIENAAFINGDGINKPKGILNYDDEIELVEIGEAGNIGINDLLNLINSLDDVYQEDACFIMNRRTLAAIQGIRDEAGRLIWQSSLSDKMADSLFGFPVYCSSEMPNLAEDNKSIIFGDFSKGYKIVDRQGISIMKDPFTEKPFVKFYATKRVGGDVVDFNSFKILKA